MNISVYVDKRRPRKDGSFGVYLRFKGRGCPPYLIHTGVSCRYAPVGMVFPSTEPNGVAKGIRVMELYSKCVEFDYRNSDVIAQALGHSTPYMTTDIYVNRRLRKIDEANRRVIDYFKSGV